MLIRHADGAVQDVQGNRGERLEQSQSWSRLGSIQGALEAKSERIGRPIVVRMVAYSLCWPAVPEPRSV